MKIVVNTFSGGTFSLSAEAVKLYGNYSGVDTHSKTFYFGGISRADPALIRVVEELGKKAYGSRTRLEIREIPDDVEWEIVKTPRTEEVHEKHRVW